MTSDMESIYWETNPEWWTIVDDHYVLTDKATERAKKSFELFMSKETKPND